MSDVGESRVPADFRDIFIGLHKHPLGIHDPCNIHILDNGAVGIPLELPAQVVGTHIGHLGQLVYGYVLLVILVDIADYICYPVALFRLHRCLNVSGNGQ